MQQDLYPLKVIYSLTSSSTSILWANYMLTALATLVMLLNHLNILLLLIICCTALQHYLYIRVQFDRQLLQQLTTEHTELEQNTQYLDQALLQLELIKATKANRPWAIRLAGILRLFKFQYALLIITFILFIIALGIGIK